YLGPFPARVRPAPEAAVLWTPVNAQPAHHSLRSPPGLRSRRSLDRATCLPAKVEAARVEAACAPPGWAVGPSCGRHQPVECWLPVAARASPTYSLLAAPQALANEACLPTTRSLSHRGVRARSTDLLCRPARHSLMGQHPPYRASL